MARDPGAREAQGRRGARAQGLLRRQAVAALTRPRHATGGEAAVGLAFFLSGGAALVYQVAWQRILALHSGVGIYSVAMIVAAFMAGLGIGSHLGGLCSLRLARSGALLAFAAVELAIGACGALSCAVYYDWLYPLAGRLYGSPWVAGLLHFLALLLPTALMGLSLPLLARGMLRDAADAGRTLGWLYGLNVIGASLGALATPWLLMPAWGVRGATLAAACANLVAGGAALVAWRTLGGGLAGAAASALAPASAAGGRAAPPARWLALYALSGFLALSLEVLWFRVVDVATKSTAFTFGTVLAVYLLAYGVGSLAGGRLAARASRPQAAFLLCQCLLLVYAGVGLVALATLPPSTPLYATLLRYWRGGNPLLAGSASPLALAGLYVGLPALLFGPATLLMGVSFPLLQRAVQDDPRTSGFKVGLLQAANIAGCVAGSLLAGLLGLSLLGTSGTLRVLLACGLLLAVLGLRQAGPRVFALPTVALALLLFAQPDGEALWRRLHGVSDAERALVDEDASAVAVLGSRHAGRWRLFTGGHSHSQFPYGGMHTVLGALPALVHPLPREVAVIGLGSGDSAWAASCREEVARLTVFEIAAPQPRLLRRLAEAEQGPPELLRLLADPRLALRVADGRAELQRGTALYDVIEIDALWPYYSGSGNLYSVEFYRLALRRLAPGGILCTWAPTRRVRESFRSVFSHVLAGREVLLGSDAPLPRAGRAWRERLAQPAVASCLGPERAAAVDAALGQLEPLAAAARSGPRNFDLRPRDEFDAREGE